MINAYFISGMGASCQCFDYITLPDGYERNYIEWLAPEPQETLDDYTRRMAKNIDTSKPFILIGYSFGGVIVQEMNKFLSPINTILIASIKNEIQRPTYFKWAKRLTLDKHIPTSIFSSWKVNMWIVTRFVYKNIGKNKNVESFLPMLNPTYMKWAIFQIINWRPTIAIPHLYQIHGDKDSTFPIKKIFAAYTSEENKKSLFIVPKVGHLLVFQNPKRVSTHIATILQS